MEPAFHVLRATDAVSANRLVNGDFSRSDGRQAAGWSPYQSGYALLPEGGRSGAGIYCRNLTPGQGSGASQTVVLDQAQPVPILVRGWSRCRGVGGARSSNYSVYVDLLYQDGTPLWARTARFRTNEGDWEARQVVIQPTQPVASLTVYALFRGMSGEAWFDDIEVRELGGGDFAVLDLLPVMQATVPEAAGTTKQTWTADGLSMDWAAGSGRLAELAAAGEDLLGVGRPSGFVARDVAADSDLYAFRRGECPELGLRLSVDASAEGEAIFVSGKLEDTTGQDRAVTLTYLLPVGGPGWTWHDDMRNSREITSVRETSHVSDIGTGANGGLSVYPVGCITGPDHGLAMAIDMGQPAQYRIGYSGGAGQFYLSYDFGLCAETASFPGAAPFRFVIYRTDPAWGFRSALEKLYRIFPDYFLCRSPEQGIWMPFTDVSTVQGWQDFGFRYHEGVNNVPFDDGAGILSFRYTEPGTWWMSIPEDVPRTRENVLRSLRDTAAQEGWRGRYARATLVSGSFDEGGEYQYLVRDTPWCNGVVFSLNPDPHIPGESEASMYWNDEVKERLYGPAANGEQDGEYLDSLEGYVTANENHRREHFASATVPLTFTTESKKPVIQKGFSQYELTRWMSEGVHGMGKLMFANSVPSQFSFLCPWLDVMGRETDWLTADGGWRPLGDEPLNLYRAMCCRKPYCFLMNTQFPRFTPDLVEKYFQRCLCFGIWPSMFSHNASEDPYWQQPDYYNRDRHLFKRYIPLVRMVAEAGWEPVTHARSDDGDIWVERFGPGEDGSVYVTVFNSSSERRNAAVRVDASALGVDAPDGVPELVRGGTVAARTGGDDGILELDVPLGSEEIALLRFMTSRAR